MNQPHILSLAWKYHPAITSGVGVACEGLNNALSTLTHLTVIYPNVSKIQHKREVLLSRDNLTEDQRQSIFDEYKNLKPISSFELPVLLDPYFVSITSGVGQKEVSIEKATEAVALENDQGLVKIDEVYDELLFDDVDVFGENVRDKIFVYNRLVEELADGISFDLIHAHDWMTFLAGIKLKERFHKPLILHVHSLEYDRVGHKDVSWVYGVERFAMSKADLVITTSEYTKGIIEDSYGLSGHKIHVVHNAVTPPVKIQTAELPKNHKFRVLFAGRIDGAKGIEYFLQIAGQAIRRSKEFEFLIAGKGIHDLEFEDIDGYKELKQYVKFLGFVEREQLFGIYNSCDALCMPAISEPFGLTAIEAASVGLPVILSNQGWRHRSFSVKHQKPDFWDISKYVDFLVSLKDDPRYKAKVINNNKAAVEQLSWDKSAARVTELYKMFF
ncbi:MAG: glycosyltransferase [Cyclobacteriaceae bacterium]|nr:glycosyltransferase [Cyclobacteriaceae bacterium]